MPRRDDYKLKYYNLFIELRLNLPALGTAGHEKTIAEYPPLIPHDRCH
jgi:hypothetical protein